MLTKKEKLLTRPFILQKYDNHRRKIQSAKPAIDFNPPNQYGHVQIKFKKIQRESERLNEIERENRRLLQRLGEIMNSRRLENYWRQPPPNFLNREFLYKQQPRVRPKTAQLGEDEYGVKKPNSTYARCSVCSGKSISKNEIIPEERIPWAPPKKSWNQKISNGIPIIYKRCKCCSS